MSGGREGTPSLADLATDLVLTPLYSADIKPPALHQSTVGNSTNPPKADAYGLESTTASRRKSAARPVREPSANFWYPGRLLTSLRRTPIIKPIRIPNCNAFSTCGCEVVIPLSAPTNLYVMADCHFWAPSRCGWVN